MRRLFSWIAAIPCRAIAIVAEHAAEWMAKGNKHARTKFKKWLNSYNDVSSWLEKKCPDIEQLLEEHGGLVKIENFLPAFVADGVLELLESIDDKTWNLTAAQDDYVHNNIRHEFLSVKEGPPCLQDVFRVFTLLLPDSLFTFSAAKYCKAGHIVAHDDRAYTNVMMDDGSVQLCSRNIACIYYLTKDWTDADGGQLVDLEAEGGPQVHVPKYNSIIAFTIPRWHEVKPVTGNRPRFSVFGWFLEPGQLYPLNTGSDSEQEQHEEQQQDIQQACCNGVCDKHGAKQHAAQKKLKKERVIQQDMMQPEHQQQQRSKHKKERKREQQAHFEAQQVELQHPVAAAQIERPGEHKQQHAKRRRVSEVPGKPDVASKQLKHAAVNTCSAPLIHKKKLKKKTAVSY